MDHEARHVAGLTKAAQLLVAGAVAASLLALPVRAQEPDGTQAGTPPSAESSAERRSDERVPLPPSSIAEHLVAESEIDRHVVEIPNLPNAPGAQTQEGSDVIRWIIDYIVDRGVFGGAHTHVSCAWVKPHLWIGHVCIQQIKHSAQSNHVVAYKVARTVYPLSLKFSDIDSYIRLCDYAGHITLRFANGRKHREYLGPVKTCSFLGGSVYFHWNSYVPPGTNVCGWWWSSGRYWQSHRVDNLSVPCVNSEG